MLFREAVIGFFTGGGKGEKSPAETDEEYLESLKAVKNGG